MTDEPKSLIDCIRSNDIASLKVALDGGADVNRGDNVTGEMPLHLAVKLGNLEAAKLLIAENANVNAYNKDGLTPLLLATNELANGNSVPGIEAYAPAKDSVVQLDENALQRYRARPKSQSDLVKLLLENKADPNKTLSTGESALHLASYQERDECVEMLLKHGANPHIKNGRGQTPLEYARDENFGLDKSKINSRAACVEKLLQHAMSTIPPSTPLKDTLDGVSLGLMASLKRSSEPEARLSEDIASFVKEKAVPDTFTIPTESDNPLSPMPAGISKADKNGDRRVNFVELRGFLAASGVVQEGGKISMEAVRNAISGNVRAPVFENGKPGTAGMKNNKER